MKVAVSGGGTGGHTLPVLAVIDNLKKEHEDVKIFFVGSRFGIESQLIPRMGIKYYGISAGKFRRYHKSKILNLIDPSTLYLNARDFFRFVAGIRDSYKVLSYEKPDVVFAKGGYVSLPVGIASRLLKIPVVIHESDTVMGLSNNRMSMFAKTICVTFPKKFYPEIKEEKIEVTGNPIRSDIAFGKGDSFKSSIGFEKNRKTILILGGSQGSLFINETFLDILNEILNDYQVIWIAGERDIDLVNYKIKELSEEKQKHVKVFGFVTSELADIYAASDLVITRAGSNVLFELAALGKPAILIPIETMAGGHQFENAKYFSRNGAAYLMRQKDITPKKLLHQISYLFSSSEEMVKLSEKMKEIADKDASSKVAEIIYATGKENLESTRKDQKDG